RRWSPPDGDDVRARRDAGGLSWTRGSSQGRIDCARNGGDRPGGRTAPRATKAIDEAAATAAGREMADKSPRVTFPGAVFPVGYAKGAVDERPVHDVSFPPFSMMVDEVTVDQYARCVAVGR